MSNNAKRRAKNTALVITGAIDIRHNQVPFTRITDTQTRLDQYLDSIGYAIRNYRSIDKIVFVENSLFSHDYTILGQLAQDGIIVRKKGILHKNNFVDTAVIADSIADGIKILVEARLGVGYAGKRHLVVADVDGAGNHQCRIFRSSFCVVAHIQSGSFIFQKASFSAQNHAPSGC